MRHSAWRIGEREREAWLSHMRVAVDELELEPDAEKALWDYLVMAAYSMVNSTGSGATPGGALPVVS
jgi:hemoglobin